MSKYKVGQLVRKRLKKATFAKGYKQQWSTKTYTIKEGRVARVNATLETTRYDLQVASEDQAVHRAEKVARVERALVQEGEQDSPTTNTKRKSTKNKLRKTISCILSMATRWRCSRSLIRKLTDRVHPHITHAKKEQLKRLHHDAVRKKLLHQQRRTSAQEKQGSNRPIAKAISMIFLIV